MTRFNPFSAAMLIVLVASMVAIAPAHAAPGDLDPTFSGDGKATTEFAGGAAVAVALQGDGKIVAVGRALGDGMDFALARYNADGSRRQLV